MYIREIDIKHYTFIPLRVAWKILSKYNRSLDVNYTYAKKHA